MCNAFLHIRAAFVKKKNSNAFYNRTLKAHLPRPSKTAKYPYGKLAPSVKPATAKRNIRRAYHFMLKKKGKSLKDVLVQ